MFIERDKKYNEHEHEESNEDHSGGHRDDKGLRCLIWARGSTRRALFDLNFSLIN